MTRLKGKRQSRSNSPKETVCRVREGLGVKTEAEELQLLLKKYLQLLYQIVRKPEGRQAGIFIVGFKLWWCCLSFTRVRFSSGPKIPSKEPREVRNGRSKPQDQSRLGVKLMELSPTFGNSQDSSSPWGTCGIQDLRQGSINSSNQPKVNLSILTPTQSPTAL